MKKLIVLLLLCSNVYGAEYFLVDKLNFEAGRYYSRAIKPEFNLPNEDEYLTNSVSVNWDVSLFKFNGFAWFWNNKVEGLSTNRQFRATSWYFENGFSMPYVDLFILHKSEHYLDGIGVGHFPLDDRFIIRMKFIDSRGL